MELSCDTFPPSTPPPFPLLPHLPQSGQLNEYTERKEMSADVVCMSLGTVPPGEQRSRFLAVGLADQTVRIISLDPSVSHTPSSSSHTHTHPHLHSSHMHPSQDTLQPLSMQALPAPPESLCIVEMGGSGEGERGMGSMGGLFLNIGLLNGVLLKTALDSITGDLSDTRTRSV